MMKQLFVCSLLTNFFVFQATAQSPIEPLQVYDTIPDMTFAMVNYPSPTVEIRDFRGKLLILDFWSTWCSNCIEAFPKIASLQYRFKNDIMILPVGFQRSTADDIRRFYKRQKEKGDPVKVPSAIQDTANGDTILTNLFPLKAVPLLVWIDSTGRIMGITSQHTLNVETIRKYLDVQNEREKYLNR